MTSQLAISEEGVRLRELCELDTDRLSMEPIVHLGPERTNRLEELSKELLGRVIAAGAFPSDLGVVSPVARVS